MANGAVNFNLEAQDDPVLPDQVPSFEGGQFSNMRANLLQPNQSKVLANCDIDRLGKIRTRRGTILLGDAPPDPLIFGKIIQGLTSYQTPTANYVVAAHNRKIWKYTGNTTPPHTSGWEQIALGGIADQAEMLIYREGKIDRPFAAGPPVIPAGYTAGTTVLTVKEVGYVGVTAPPSAQGGIIGVGEKLYFSNNLRTDWYEYTVAAVSGGPPVTQITLEEPGLVFDVKDGWKFIVARPAKNVGAHLSPTGTPYTGTLTITGYTGVVNHGEYFVIKSENRRYTVDTFAPASPASTTSLTGAWGSLATDFVAPNDTGPIVFAQGNDKLYFSSGTGPIYAWDGTTLMNITAASTLDYSTGSVLHQARTAPPQNVSILLWFQNRLIASGIPTEPDAIYFSDYFDGTSWDQDYQKVRIGGGESDPITGLLAWTDYNLLVFKKNSIYVINLDPAQNPTPDDPTLLVASFSVKQLHKLIGCPAPNSAIQVGGGSTTPGSDVFFCDGDKKIHSVRRVMAAEQQQEVGTAVSMPIQDVMDSINLDHIDKAVAMYHNEHYIIGIPSMRGTAGGLLNNVAVAYNLLTQSWCGEWNWAPTCFSRRTDLGSYSKLIFGDTSGYVQQWMDDISLEEETETSYMDKVNSADNGFPVRTQILTRAFTGGDAYSFKTGLNVEFEFDESVADTVTVQIILDKVPHPTLIADPFSTLSEPRLRLPFPIPVRLPASPGMLRKVFDLQRYGTWRELQFVINTTAPNYGKLAIRSIRMTFFMDTMRLQTIPNTGVLESAGSDLPTVPEFLRYSGNPIIGDGWGSPVITQVEEFMPFVNPLDPTQLIAIFSGVTTPGDAQIYYATSPATDGYTWTIQNSEDPIISDRSRRLDSMVINGTNIRLYSTRYPGSLTDGIDCFEQTFTGLAGLTSWTYHPSVLLPTGTETQVSQAAVLKDGSTYYLYYSYRTASATLPGIRVCTSSDGLTWVRANGGADIISRGAAGTCDHTFFEFHQIQKFGGQYIITSEVYGGPEGVADGSMWHEGMYFSNSPTSGWQRSASNPVFSGSGVAGTPDRYHVATPWWSYINGTWRLFYQASDTDPFSIYYISATWTVCEATLTAGATPANLIPVATAYVLSGPVSGAVSVPSTNFTVALPSGYVLPSSVIVTMNDSGGGGTFTPAAVVLSTASPSATFTYTPTAGVIKTIKTTNDGGLTNPSPLSYAIVVPLVDGDLVSTWLDSSGNGNHATMTGSNRPTFKTAIVNGKPVVRFTSAGLSKLNLTTPISGAFPWIVFTVMKQATGASRIDSLDGNATSGVPFGMTIVGGGGTYCYSQIGYANGTPATTAAWHILEGICAGAPLASHFVVEDGVNITGGSVASANTGNFTTIGYDSVTPTYCDGDIAEIIIYAAAISGTDRVNVEKYLADKYAITVPAGGTAVQPDTVASLVGWWKADSLG